MNFLKDYKIQKINNKLTFIFIAIILILAACYVFFNKFHKDLNNNKPTYVKKECLESDDNNNISSQNQTTTEPTSFFENYVPESDIIVNDDYFMDVVFVGDSVTNGIQLYKSAKNALIISKTGLNIESIINDNITIDNKPISVLKAIKQSNRKKIYIMIGSNGIGWLENDYMVNLYSNWLNEVKEEIPGCLIYVQSVLPITKELSDHNLKKENSLTNEKIEKYNNDIFNMCKTNHFFYLNVSEVFKDKDGALPEDASPVDGMHINSNYYNIWLNYIKSHTLSNESLNIINSLSQSVS